VVDIDRVLKSYPGAEARQNDWQAMEASFKTKMDGLKVQAQEAAADRESFDEGTEDRARANLQYELKRLEYEETAKIFTAKADQFRMDIALDLYAEIRRGIAAFAKAKGIHAVLRARSDNPALPKSARLETNQQRDVLFHDPSIELTEDVIRFLKTWKPDEGK
jgi:Skp family chaperone for outer membrane proteins